MGYGDEIIGSGLAKGAAARGKRIAFGDGASIRWHHYANEIYRGNPNVAPPGSESANDLEWIKHYPGCRIYNQGGGKTWLWKPGQIKQPGEIYFDEEELQEAEKLGSGFIIIEPNVPAFKQFSMNNRRWGYDKWNKLAKRLLSDGYEVVQFHYPPPHGPGHTVPGARTIKAKTFRIAIATIARAKLLVSHEGGLPHGAAAVGTLGVVLFGGFISPAVTGYDMHTNIFTGGKPCGNLKPCEHCKQAWAKITVDDVYNATQEKLKCLSLSV